jgi:hypothetical protein
MSREKKQSVELLKPGISSTMSLLSDDDMLEILGGVTCKPYCTFNYCPMKYCGDFDDGSSGQPG